MNRRDFVRCLCATGAATALSGGWAFAAAPQATRALTMTSHYSLEHPVTEKVFLPWATTLRERSRGTLDLRIAPPDELCPDEHVYNAVVMNAVTLGGFVPNMMISPLAVAGIMEYALLYPDARSGSQMVWDVLNNCPELREDLGLVHILWTWISPAMYLHTMGKTIQSLDDIKSLKIVVWDTTSGALVSALGAQPVFCPAHVTPYMLRMKMADGVIAPFAPLPFYDLMSLLTCTLDVPLSNACFFAAFNREVWGTLSKHEKSVLERTTGERMAAACGRTLDEGAAQIRAGFVQNGHTFMTLSKDEQKTLYAPLYSLRDAREQMLIEKNLLPKSGIISHLRNARERVLQQGLHKDT